MSTTMEKRGSVARTHGETSTAKTTGKGQLTEATTFHMLSSVPVITSAGTFCGSSHASCCCSPLTARKHSDDYFFAEAAYTHPMRVMDPTHAKLFVVPALINFLSTVRSAPKHKHLACVGGMCTDGHCASKPQSCDILIKTVRMLHDSEWFQRRQGRDHVLVASTPNANNLVKAFPALMACNAVIFEASRSSHTRVLLPTLYVGKPCAPSVIRDKDFTMVSRMKPFYKVRIQVCEWLNGSSFRKTSTCAGPGPGFEAPCTDTTRVMCSGMPQCDAFQGSKYGFHVAGDTLGSNRLMDLILSEIVPIFTDSAQYDILPFQDQVPWRLLSEEVNLDPSADGRARFLGDLKRIASDGEGFAEKRLLLRRVRSSVTWSRGNPRPFELYMSAFHRLVYLEDGEGELGL